MSLIIGLSDEVAAIVVPLIIFWVYSGLYEVAGCFMESYRLFTKEDEDRMNLVTRWDAIKGVLLNQMCQLAFSFLFLWLQGGSVGQPPLQPPLYVQAMQLMVAILVLDFAQYFGHRIFHTNNFLYKNIHAKHHQLVVPYAFGAQYQNPIETVLIDGVSAILGYMVSGMTARTAVFFMSLTIIKSVDDHSGLWLPGHPLHLLFPNNKAFHAVHHQLYGIKANFSAPYFTIWDKIMGTYIPCIVKVKEDGGGYELKSIEAHRKGIARTHQK